MNKQTSIALVCILAIVIFGGVYYKVKMDTTTLSEKQNVTDKSQTPTTMDPQSLGLKIEILQEGTGEPIASGQTATVNYTGMLTDGTVFDSSIPRGQPFTVNLGRGEVIKGWDLGLVGMKVGEKRKLTIPAELAYGAHGVPGVIPSGATLIFEVTLESIK